MEFDMRILQENFPKQAEMHVFCCKDVGLSWPEQSSVRARVKQSGADQCYEHSVNCL